MLIEQPTTSREPRIMNPLWIISLFLGVAEATAGFAATQSNGFVQAMFATFAVLFPLGVAVAFFQILWRRPYVLYAPRDFSAHTPVAAYVEAMRVPYQPTSVIEEVARTAVKSIIPLITAAGTAQDQSSAVDIAMQRVKEDLARRTITVNIAYAIGLHEVTPTISLPVDDETTVDQLIAKVALGTGHAVRAESYGRRWVLAGDSTVYTAIEPGNPDSDGDDTRNLEAAGDSPRLDAFCPDSPIPTAPLPGPEADSVTRGPPRRGVEDSDDRRAW